jgi:hypothetical protein
VLAIRAGHIRGAEQGGERLPLLGGDQDRERLASAYWLLWSLRHALPRRSPGASCNSIRCGCG